MNSQKEFAQALEKDLADPDCKMQVVLNKVREHVHEINQQRSKFGEYHHLFHLLRKYPKRFKLYMRMEINTFDYILSKVKSKLAKKWCRFHKQPIKQEEQLVVTIRFLATGMTYQDLAFAFRMGASTVCVVIKRTMKVLWKILYPIHMPLPKTQSLKEIAEDFYKIWNLPNCIGAIDVRHIEIKKPAKSGSRYYNYKGYFSIVLQAVVGPDYKFIAIDIGGYGFQHDSTTFTASTFYEALQKKIIKLPAPVRLPGCNIVVPHFFVGDGAYPLMQHLLKPYPGKDLPRDKAAFNYRLSRPRLVSECAFGQMCQRWHIFYTIIQCQPKKAELIGKVTSLLHNLLIDLEKQGKKGKKYSTKKYPTSHALTKSIFTNVDNVLRFDDGEVDNSYSDDSEDGLFDDDDDEIGLADENSYSCNVEIDVDDDSEDTDDSDDGDEGTDDSDDCDEDADDSDDCNEGTDDSEDCDEDTDEADDDYEDTQDADSDEEGFPTGNGMEVREKMKSYVMLYPLKKQKVH